VPGVGAFAACMEGLRSVRGERIIGQRLAGGRPVLGVCVGMQVLCAESEEFGPHDCLGVVGGSVRRLPDGQKVPQIGWNQLRYANGAGDHPIFANIPDDSNFYFVHSYYCDLADQRIVAGVTDYGVSFASVLLRDNLAAVQFHPEKSGHLGLQLLTNFIAWAGR